MNAIELTDQAELNTLMNAIAMNDRTLAVFAIAPDSSPLHPVVQAFKEQLVAELDGPVQFSTLHYSDDSVFRFLGRCEGEDRSPGRQVVMIFGLEQLPQPRLKQEMEQLNLGRERIFSHDLVWVFWLNREAFLDEFRRRAADFWDWRGNVVTFVTCPPMEQLLYPYLEWLIAENSYLKMSGVMQVNRQVDISLDQIYVSLQAEWVEERSQSFRERVSPGVGRSRRNSTLGEPDEFEEEFRDEPLMEMSAEPASQQRVTKMMDVAEAVRQREYGVILGDPGAGKTTLLRYLARHFAIAHREGRSTVTGGMDEDLGGARLPILFRIADFAEKLGVEPELGLVEYLRRFYRQWEGGCGADEGDAVAQLLLSKMATGDCLLLLDGLDEVLDGENRGRVVRAIDRLVSEYASNKFVITSRIAGYQEAALGSRFREFTITPMGNEQIKNFLGRWCLAIEVAQRPEAETSLHERDAAREASGIFHAIETKPGVKRFAANPLLLTILALIHRNGTQMPQRRVELYALATKTLIEDWQLGRNVVYGTQAKQLTLVEEEVTALLAPLAFRMHDEKSSGVVTQGEVEEWLMPWMAELQGVDDDVALGLVREFLRKVRETTGLFVERGPGVYGFMHLTFEEYYAARHLANNDVPDILEMIQPYLYEARWNEPILLALGYLSTDQKRVNRLLERMFEGLVTYQPIVVGQEIRLKNVTSDPVLVWRSEAEGESQESAAVWKDLLFVGQILAEVKVAPKFCRQQVDKLVLTYLGLEKSYSDESAQQLLRLFRGIESFNGQVLERLRKSSEDSQLSEEQRDEALVAILYVVCGEAGDRLVDRALEIIKKLTPSLFDEIDSLMAELGLEMTSSLERTLEDSNLDEERRRSLEFMAGLSYLRSDNYDRAIERLQPLADQADCHLDGFIDWAIAIAYEKKEDYKQGLNYYQQCSDKLKSVESLTLWRYWGICYRSHKKYEESLACFRQAIMIAGKLNHQQAEAILLWHIGKTYQSWEKYDEAVLFNQQSLDLYQGLNKPKNVANQWHWIGSIYQEWKKYEDAIRCQKQCLELRQLENDKSSVALSFRQLGQIYQAWVKYEDAIEQYQRSRDLYKQLDKEKDVSNLWYSIGDCYKDWHKYEKAVESQKQCLELRRLEEDSSRVAVSLYQLGRIYQAWGKYEDAIEYYQQSLEIYQQLEKNDAVNLWYWIGDCYKAWGKYEKAVKSQQEYLELQKLEDNRPKVAISLHYLGGTYQSWGKYKDAIECHHQSQIIYRKLERDSNVADQWKWISDCYRKWDKYKLALDSEQQNLSIRLILDVQSEIAHTYFRQGRIYQAWSKYEEAIEHYQQSRDLHQKLERDINVSNQWYWIGDCYKDWGKYELAIECQRQCLRLREIEGDRSDIAVSLYQLGRIYQAWGKYEEAIDYYQQSQDFYHQLEKEKDVVNQWYWMGDCYKDWGKYEKAIECQQACLCLRRLEEDESRVAVFLHQLGRIYQAWGKYEEAIDYYQKSRNLYQQLEKEKDVANLWSWMATCYRDLGKYERAIECQQQCLALRRLEEDESSIAVSLYQLGRIYQAWNKYEEAIDYYQQSRDLNQHLDKEKNVADLWYWIAGCYRQWNKYAEALKSSRQYLVICQKPENQREIAIAHSQFGRIYQSWNKYGQAIEYHQQSLEIYQQLDKTENIVRQLRRIADSQRKLAQETADRPSALNLLSQAEQNLQQAIQLNTENEYQETLAYDRISLSLLYADRLRLPQSDTTDLIHQFETYYPIGLTTLLDLGQTVRHAEETLDIARAYLEIPALQNLTLAETFVGRSLETFQEFNRRKLQANAHKLLGEIYNANNDTEAAVRSFQHSREIYCAIDLPGKVEEVERLMG